MSGFSPTLENLIGQFRSLPGVGYKSAVRLAFHIINSTDEKVAEFTNAVIAAKHTIKKCEICKNISDDDICSICDDSGRDKSVICVVESPKDVITFEKIKEYRGVYHVLHGAISPLDGITPDDIFVRDLVIRCGNIGTNSDSINAQDAEVKEVILATGSNVEGEATSVYIAKLLKPFGIKTTRLAFGIPVGGDLEYADEMTLFRALEGRREI